MARQLKRQKLEVKEEATESSQGTSSSQGHSLADSQSTMSSEVPESEALSYRQFEDAASILEFARHGDFSKMARSLHSLIGLKVSHLSPKRALNTFFERYTAHPTSDKKADHYFQHEFLQQKCRWTQSPVVATLITPSFFNRSFRGVEKQDIWEAENSACECFFQDEDVVDVCQRIPPSLSKLRAHVWLSPPQQEALRAEGHDPAALRMEMRDKLYCAFRELGCRTAVWDGNF